MYYTLECRATGKGASTSAYVLRGKATITVVSRSASGAHWVEEIAYADGDVIFIQDVTNSGKHGCRCIGATLEEAEKLAPLPCGMAARHHRQ